MTLKHQSIQVDEIEICYEEGSGRKWVKINGHRMWATTEANVNFSNDPMAEVTITFVTDNVTVVKTDPNDGSNA